MTKYVYFIKPVGMHGPIKIGCSSFVDDRLSSLMTWSPFPLEVLYQQEGSLKLERQIHEAFADLHQHREWFHPGERLIAAIKKLQAGVPLVEAIDLTDSRGSIRKLPKGMRRKVLPGMEGYLSYSSRLRHAAIKADKAVREKRVLPDDIGEIMRRWDGYCGYRQPRAPVRPTADEFRRLDEVIADPAAHCVRPSWFRPKRKATPISKAKHPEAVR